MLLDEPTFPGICVTARPVGVCWTTSASRLEPKLICVPLDDPSFDQIDALDDVPKYKVDEIRQFFDTYKVLDSGDDCHTDHFDGREVALSVIRKARKRHS